MIEEFVIIGVAERLRGRDSRRVRRRGMGCAAIKGDATEESVLEAVGLERARARRRL